jgi:hypothetical protein
MKWIERLRAFRLEKERVAVSLLALSFFSILYALAAFSSPVAWRPAFLALALCYGVAFFSLASQWFWARWFASGLAWSGATLGLVALVMVGWHPMLAVFGALHAVVLAMLAGPHMVSRFEMQAVWRERYGMDEFGVARLGRVVTRTAAALPSLIMWALAPREGQGAWLFSGLALTCALSGLLGVLRLRTWGVLSLATSASLILAGLLALPSKALGLAGWLGSLSWVGQGGSALLAGGLLLAAIAPVAKAVRWAWRSWS